MMSSKSSMHYVQKAKKYFNYCPTPDLNPEHLAWEYFQSL